MFLSDTDDHLAFFWGELDRVAHEVENNLGDALHVEHVGRDILCNRKLNFYATHLGLVLHHFDYFGHDTSKHGDVQVELKFTLFYEAAVQKIPDIVLKQLRGPVDQLRVAAVARVLDLGRQALGEGGHTVQRCHHLMRDGTV